jgi:hypothetical protein
MIQLDACDLRPAASSLWRTFVGYSRQDLGSLFFVTVGVRDYSRERERERRVAF